MEARPEGVGPSTGLLGGLERDVPSTQFDPITGQANQGEIAGRATYDDPAIRRKAGRGTQIRGRGGTRSINVNQKQADAFGDVRSTSPLKS